MPESVKSSPFTKPKLELKFGTEIPISRQNATTCKRRSPLKRFHLFPKLPTELRFMVWHFSIPESRVIEVLWNSETGRYYTDALQPSLLQACRESRNEGKRVYHALELNLDGGFIPELARYDLRALQRMSSREPFRTYIDWKRDHLSMNAEHVASRLARAHFIARLSQSPKASANLRSIILDARVIESKRLYIPQPGSPRIRGTFFILLNLLAMSKLMTIHVTSSPSRCYKCRGGISRCHRRVLGIDSMGIEEGQALEHYCEDVLEVFEEWKEKKLGVQLSRAMALAGSIWGVRKPEMIPEFILLELLREKKRRYRPGPYGLSQRRWA
ncbi:uncharacterized protein BP5553_02467 [Venustampulla echinocandica]|uniref:2EXR domain-containing protein n=1 Tax=Venustampulla echinocandica TaxID=2656787 RepID=A0A370U3Z5_9HELO|nr:uncharacterized protein BP5553_02467 [Venustampulla echinocandica]RDL42488.1 hypothetical protein BP5553_02467 [Venustampulla echinocandica]